MATVGSWTIWPLSLLLFVVGRPLEWPLAICSSFEKPTKSLSPCLILTSQCAVRHHAVIAVLTNLSPTCSNLTPSKLASSLSSPPEPIGLFESETVDESTSLGRLSRICRFRISRICYMGQKAKSFTFERSEGKESAGSTVSLNCPSRLSNRSSMTATDSGFQERLLLIRSVKQEDDP